MENKFRFWINVAALIVIVACIIGLLIASCRVFNNKPPQTYRITLTVSPDSVYDEKKFSFYTDSLICVINKHEHVIADKYEAILDEKEDVQKYWSIAGILVSIILGITGFFGFGTIKDIERQCKEKAEQVAESKAGEIARFTSKRETGKYLNENLEKEVKNASKFYLGTQEQLIHEIVNAQINQSLGNINERLDNLEFTQSEIELAVPKNKNSKVSTASEVKEQSDSQNPINNPILVSASKETDLFS